MMKRQAGWTAVVLLLLVVACLARADEGNLKEVCSNDFQKVVSCFDFVTGKVAAPSRECCDSIMVIKDSKPACLCFFIQQTHNGNQQIKSMGILEGKLLQLPSVCNLKNSSVSYCPKLLGLPPNSTDAAIFANSSFPATPSSTVTPTSHGGNSGATIVANHPASLMAMAFVVLIAVLPAIPSASRA